MKQILYSLLISTLIISCNKPSQDDPNPPGAGDDLKKLVEKIDLAQDGTKLCSFEFTYNVDKTIKTLAVKLTDKYTSGVCNLAGYTETYTFDTKSAANKMQVLRDRASSSYTSFSFDLDNKGRVVSGVNNSNTNMTASYKYSADGILTQFEQGIMRFDYPTSNGQKFVIESFLGIEEGRISYPTLTPGIIFDRSKINIDLNMLLVCMKSTSSNAVGIAFLDPMFLGMVGYLGGRESLVGHGSRGFQGALKYTTDNEGSPIKITSNITVEGKVVVNSYEITYLQ